MTEEMVMSLATESIKTCILFEMVPLNPRAEIGIFEFDVRSFDREG